MPMPSRSRKKLPPTYPSSAVPVPTTNSTATTSTDLLSSTRPRAGTAANVVRIMPVPYSVVTSSAPSTTAVIWAIIIPQVMNDPADSSASGEASQSAFAQHISTVSPAPSPTVAASVHHVERTV